MHRTASCAGYRLSTPSQSLELFDKATGAAAFVSMLAVEFADAAWESGMTVHAPKLFTPEEFASLLEIAVTSPNPTIPAPHLSKLINLGYVAMTLKGLVVTGDGLIRITESE
jgi:hypothetical protein